VKLTKDTPTSNKDFEGYIPDLLEKLANQSECNCKFDLKLVADGTYGIKEGEKWSGMIGEILDEVCITAVFIYIYIVCVYSKQISNWL